MYMMKDLDTVNAVCDLYKDGATIKDVASVAHMSPNVVGDILRERGLTRPRGGRAKNSIASFARTCPLCGNTKHFPGAAFCMACGSVLATRRELVRDAINRVRRTMRLCIASGADELDWIERDLNSIEEYINACKEG